MCGKLVNGYIKRVNGWSKRVNGRSELVNGCSKFVDGCSKLVNGCGKLADPRAEGLRAVRQSRRFTTSKCAFDGCSMCPSYAEVDVLDPRIGNMW